MIIPTRKEYYENIKDYYNLKDYDYNWLIDILEVYIVTKHVEYPLSKNMGNYEIEKDRLIVRPFTFKKYKVHGITGIKIVIIKGNIPKEEKFLNLFKGYEIARLISYNAIKEGTYIQQYIDGEECKTDGIYIIHNRAIYSLKLWIDELGLELLPFEEVGISILCDEGIEFKIIEDELEKPIFRRDTKLKDECISKCNKVVKKEKIHYCEQCEIPILDEKIRVDFHGCCSSKCEKEKINNYLRNYDGYCIWESSLKRGNKTKENLKFYELAIIDRRISEFFNLKEEHLGHTIYIDK